MRGRFLSLVCLVALGAAVGCGGLGTLYPVEGKAEVDGKPLPQGVKIQFWPQAKLPAPAEISGTVDASGNYKMETNGKTGVPKGKYKVTVNTTAPVAATGDITGMANKAKEAAKPVNPKYEDVEKSDLFVDVPTTNPFTLKFTK
jgi:hypothetical protein